MRYKGLHGAAEVQLRIDLLFRCVLGAPQVETAGHPLVISIAACSSQKQQTLSPCPPPCHSETPGSQRPAADGTTRIHLTSEYRLLQSRSYHRSHPQPSAVPPSHPPLTSECPRIQLRSYHRSQQRRAPYGSAHLTSECPAPPIQLRSYHRSPQPPAVPPCTSPHVC